MIADVQDIEGVGRDMYVRGEGLMMCRDCRHPGYWTCWDRHVCEG